MSDRIVILGAGPTGLGAAYRLAELGHQDWDDLRARRPRRRAWPRAIATPHGFIWDHGGHVMFSHYTLLRRTGREDAARRLRRAHPRGVGVAARAVRALSRSRTTSTGLPPDAFLECIMGIIEAQQRLELPRRTSRRASPPSSATGIAEHFMRPYNFKVWAHPLEMMGDTVAGRPSARRSTCGASSQNLLDDRDDVELGSEQQVQVPAARYRNALRPHRRSAAEARRLPQDASTRIDVRQQGRSRSPTASDVGTTSSSRTMPLTELRPVDRRRARESS